MQNPSLAKARLVQDPSPDVPAEGVVDDEWNSHAFLSRMSVLVPGIIYVFNHQTQSNEYSNRSIADLIGFSPEEIRQMGDTVLEKVIHPDDIAGLGAYFAGLRRLAPGEQDTYEYRARAKSGKDVWLYSVDTVFDRAADGSVLRHIGLASDITRQKQAEQRLMELNAELEARVAARTDQLNILNRELEARVARRTLELSDSVRELEQLTYVATHDLKVPINNMCSLSSMLNDTADDMTHEHRETLSWMQNVCNQARDKLEALVSVAQVQSNRLPPFGPVALDDILAAAKTALQPLIARSDARVTCDFSAAPTVHFARAEMANIVENLLSNALKYADPARPPVIHLASWSQDGMDCLAVRDNGTGLDLPRDRDKVFGLFKRAHAAPEGSGVALHAISRLMQRIGGRIDVDGAPDQGAVFTLRFPVKGQIFSSPQEDSECRH
ncbi:PAS domain-containing sensor histidine kinase [Sulfitobacter sabulilitoris]|uniref:histidine kinase n=1 Tax=Sulfitobacter sabulilitoris TaxID=2562655 RepID=A0A5S3PD42_9RHOB|nr:HAMP domain-containing sensor histidine kinase [Sulfitobacter sabulilitoris]TMM50777.1 HAMP domain-containing histidine kinase [Sulfitobacter sabulilitoris]